MIIIYTYVLVFIHRSIKTRIETFQEKNYICLSKKFLYIDPLKQGLKHEKGIIHPPNSGSFYT